MSGSGRSSSRGINAWGRNKGKVTSKPDVNSQRAEDNHFVGSQVKFKEAQKKLQAAVQKYAKDYDSSSEEEELETDHIIGSILKTYTQTGTNSNNLLRTQTFLEDTFNSGACTCLICISSIKRIEAIWSCDECYCIFHLTCIQRWSKDTIIQQKQSLEEIQTRVETKKITWGCPKCRKDYGLSDVPTAYKCFCQKSINPAFQPYLVPHSCGESCQKNLKPFCGHSCVLLCHPGPCPPCPQTVSVSCFCGIEPPRPQRCSNREWSCGAPCGKLLTCSKHKCILPCHSGDCQPCPKKSIQKCLCGANHKLRDCSTPLWKCDRVCKKKLKCAQHECEEICHAGECDLCVLSKPRTCPCGKSIYNLACTEDTPTCGDTCGKLLECGAHICNQRCHKDKCGTCLAIVSKSCRCGVHTREVQCRKPYLCDTKCKKLRDCNKHPCNRKCCDGDCPACEKPCGRTLSCGYHKCLSICHRGPCYPCNSTDIVACRCGSTTITVPCGRRNKTRPPKCNRLCLIPSDCHHKQREPHQCHFDDCPPCKQKCNKVRSDCGHKCPAPCHSAVLVKVEGQKATMPWEQTNLIELKALPCPNCVVPVPVTCLGEHETSNWACYSAKISSCGRLCGRLLACGNHKCSLPCHKVVEDGSACATCESGCLKARPEGCTHLCPKPCHLGPCPPCKQMLRVRCHCGLNQPYVPCSQWTSSITKEVLESCGNQCPKNYQCGHRCRSNCHSGDCPNSETCKKRIKVFCICKRIKKEFSCDVVRSNGARIDCDQVCLERLEEDRRQKEIEQEKKQKEEELKNLKELEKYEKKFQGRKRNKDKIFDRQSEDVSMFQKYRLLVIVGIVLVAICLFSINVSDYKFLL